MLASIHTHPHNIKFQKETPLLLVTSCACLPFFTWTLEKTYTLVRWVVGLGEQVSAASPFINRFWVAKDSSNVRLFIV